MDKAQAVKLLQGILNEITMPDGSAATDRFTGLRDVDGKIREARMILDELAGIPPTLLSNMADDLDFQVNSRRIRLEALARYITSALKFANTGAFEKPQKIIHAPRDFSRLTTTVPGLKEELEKRWREAQRCAHVEAYTAAVILMGSILEGLLLARAQLSTPIAYQSQKAPRDKTGKTPAIHDWNLSTLIDVAADVGWIKGDRSKFSHALRDSRNVVHPWQAVMTRSNFDQATCKTSWNVLDASVEDLFNSLP
ncbi:hypothetical protein ACO0LF_15845 [Undibacterium sp. Di27W]|uniref:hypothetical protein n=1 Tax=Undibacterium sp. Di27W TaxID=3413036 RepID=UPI003BF12DD8